MHHRIRVTRQFTFDMAHALYGYDGACKNIHGHTYRFSVTLLGVALDDPQSPKNGIVIDFKELKTIINERIIDVFDHALVLNANSPHTAMKDVESNFGKIIYAPYQPTCENLLTDFLTRIENAFPPSLILWSLRLDETPTSYAEWFASDN